MNDQITIEQQMAELRRDNERLQAELAGRQRAEDELRASEIKFSALFEKAAWAIALSSLPDGIILDVNEAFLSTFGYAKQEVVGKTGLQLDISPHAKGRAHTFTVLQEHGAVHDQIVTLRTKAGELRTFSIHVDRIDVGGRPCMLHMLQDITDRKRLEEALWNSEHEKRTILDSLAELVIHTDTHMRLLWVNKAACESVGLSRKALIGRPCYAIWGHRGDPCPGCFVVQAMNTRRIHQGEIQTSDGRIWFNQGHPVVDEEGNVTGGIEVMLDITARKRTEEALQDSESRFRRIAENMRDVVIQLDAQGRFEYISPSIGPTLGYAPEDLLGKSAFDRVHPEDRARTVEEFQRAMATGESREVEYRYPHASGEMLWLQTVTGALRDPAGQIAGLVLISRDITEHKRLESLAREHASRLQLVTDNMVDAISQIDAQRAIVYASPSVERVYGIKAEELLGHDAYERVHPEDAAQIRDQALEAIAAHAKSLRIEYRYLHGRGEHVWVESTLRLLFGENGEYAGAVLGSRDITERKRAEQALRESEERFRQIAETIKEVFWLFDWPRQRVLYVNPAYELIWGRSREALYARFEEWTNSVHPDDLAHAQETLNRILETGGGEPREYRIVRPDGSVRWISDIGYPIKDRDGKILRLTGIAEDITERKLAAEALRQANLVIENSPVVLFRWQAAEGWPVDMVSQNVVQFGYTPEELLSGAVTYSAMVYPEDLARVTREVQEYTAGGMNRYQQEYRIVTRDGEVRWVDDRTVVERDAEGRITYYQGTILDITARKQVEQSLQREQEFIHTLLENMADAVIASDATGRLVLANRATREWHSLAPSQMPQDGWQSTYRLYAADGITPLTIEMVPSVRAHLGEQIRDAAIVIRAQGQAPRYVISNCVPFYDSGGQFLGTVTVMHDQTAVRQAQKELEDAKILLEATFEQTPVPMVLASTPDNVIRVANLAAMRLLVDENDPRPIGQSLLEYKAPWQDLDGAGRPIPLAEMPLALALQGITTKNQEFCVQRQDGTQRWELVSAAPIYNAAGEQIAAFVAFPDITELKQAEKALEEKSEELERFFTVALDLLCIADTDGYFRRLNPQWQVVLGYSQQELEGQQFLDLIHPDDRASTLAAVRELSGQKVVLDFINRYRCRDGSYRWIEWRSYPAGNLIYAAARDITGRKQDEEEIRRLNEELEGRVIERTAQLEAANKEMEAFSYTVSHDLRTPLRAIDGYTRILIEDYEPHLDAEGQRVCAVIRDNTRRMARLIDDLLAFSRLSRIDLKFSPIDMEALANAVFYEVTTPEERARIDFQLAPLPPAVGDPTLIRQVWANLLANACKFSAKRERAVIQVGGRPEADENIYFVHDNGAGFDMQYAGKLFGVFQRLHSEREFAGTGVGLAIVQRVIHRHGGRVWAEGQPDQGATFHFTLRQE